MTRKIKSEKSATSQHKNMAVPDIDSYIGYWLRFVSNQVTNAFQQKLAKMNTTVAEWLLLRFLFTHAPCSPTQVSEAMGIDKGAISRLAWRLENNGLIKRTQDPNDRRLYSIELTPKGFTLVPKLAKIADENDAFFFSHLSKGQSEQIMKILKDMVTRFGFNRIPFA